jgi:hypothetical protein
MNIIKHLNKTEKYNKILEMPYIFNLLEMPPMLLLLESVGCGWEVIERA